MLLVHPEYVPPVGLRILLEHRIAEETDHIDVLHVVEPVRVPVYSHLRNRLAEIIVDYRYVQVLGTVPGEYAATVAPGLFLIMFAGFD